MKKNPECFCDRLREALRIKGITQIELCNRTGIPKSAMSQYMSGSFKPKQNRLFLIARALDVSEAWLMGYDASMERTAMPKNLTPLHTHKVRIMGDIACGEPIYANEEYGEYVETELKADFALKCKGDSMIGARIFDGDIVFVKSQDAVENGQIAAVIIDDVATLKRIYYDESSKTVQLVAENPKYAPLVYVGEQIDHIRVIGRAIAFQSDIK